MTSDISGADITEPDNVKGDECMGQLALTEAVFYILLSLQEPLSHGRVKLAAGTLYGAINTLLDKKWIDALPENPQCRKKEYVITETGRDVLKEELARLSELVENGRKIMGGEK